MTQEKNKNTIAENTARKQRGCPFAKGESGNPKGKPKGSRNKTTLAVQALLDGEAEAISRKAIELAKKGDMAAIRLIMERVLPVRRDVPITLALPPIITPEDTTGAMTIILGAVTEGEITPAEGEALAALIEQQRKNMETALLAKKIQALENVLKARNDHA